VIDIDVPDPSWESKAEAQFGKTDVLARYSHADIDRIISIIQNHERDKF